MSYKTPRSVIIETQERVGTEPDGFWGPLSERAARGHLNRIRAHYGPHKDLYSARAIRSNQTPAGKRGKPDLESVIPPSTCFYMEKDHRSNT